ncbi:MAG: alpha/beta hydrolase [Rubritepida sp.]|nr:alpha/beta hydrolase [Rubritepida sp.]
MATIQAQGARLHVEEAGSGYPILFVHEFAADHREWEGQVRHFSRSHRVITYAARGYPPSEVPEDPTLYGQDHSANDILAVLDGLGVARAHIVGLSMGAFASLLFALRHPERASAVVLAGVGGGSELSELEAFRRTQEGNAQRLLAVGWHQEAIDLAHAANRIQLKRKDPRGWEEFVAHLREHSALGSALTRRHYQGGRDPVYHWEEQLRGLNLPILLAVGDEDGPCIDASVFLKRVLPDALLWMAPGTGHAINLEEPAAFNREVEAFLNQVERRASRS